MRLRRKRPPTDFELLDEIERRHRNDYLNRLDDRATKIMVPIDIESIAEHLGIDPNSVFGRLYYHLDPIYGEEKKEGQPRKFFFSKAVGPDADCINFPLLEAVLPGLAQERRRDLQALIIAVISLTVAVASFFVSIFI
jgi:hypothetical protein